MRTFTINKVVYNAKPFDFNMICDLEDMGINIEDGMEKPMVLTRGYFALCSNLNKNDAGKEMQLHLSNGETFDELTEVMMKELEESDFFLALSKESEEETPKTQSKAKTTKNTKA